MVSSETAIGEVEPVAVRFTPLDELDVQVTLYESIRDEPALRGVVNETSALEPEDHAGVATTEVGAPGRCEEPG